jgi:arylsulfatase A-like enzyme
MVRPRSVCPEMVLNIDIAPTVLDLAEVAIPDTMQGESLRPLLAGQQTAWRKSFLYEYFEEDWLPGIPTMLGVRTEQWKYVQYPDIHDLDELYHLETDPYEMHNLAQDPSFNPRLVEMKGELGTLLRQTHYQ